MDSISKKKEILFSEVTLMSILRKNPILVQKGSHICSISSSSASHGASSCKNHILGWVVHRPVDYVINIVTVSSNHLCVCAVWPVSHLPSSDTSVWHCAPSTGHGHVYVWWWLGHRTDPLTLDLCWQACSRSPVRAGSPCSCCVYPNSPQQTRVMYPTIRKVEAKRRGAEACGEGLGWLSIDRC